MTTIAVYSLKGGVGKTTLAANLAWCAATRSSRRTLLWDLDPQAAASWILGREGKRDRAQAAFSREVDAHRLIRPTGTARLDLLPADASLRDLDHQLREMDKKKRLSKLIAGLGDYDCVILDCPPGLTETAEQVARAADLIVIPVLPSPLAQRAYHEVERHLGGRTATLPVHAMVDRRRRMHLDMIAARSEWPVIPMASVVETASAAHRAVGEAAPRSAAAAAFLDIWQRIERRLAF
ncbi:ParA family protein [uncultured Sphingomonas sp.]|uniref:ParA family protein n=1 Tax=uncultured Sphingomonas sp. TaxID=158754 RepID=UPI00262BB0AC|nr:ParA family protein [uncultured Sphingomonas sp.]